MRKPFPSLAMMMLLVAPCAAAGELDHIIVSEMPEVRGTVESSLTGIDARAGVTFAKIVYARREGGLAVAFHVVWTRCTGSAGLGFLGETSVVAVQHRIVHSRRHEEAMRCDMFAEVDVRDPEDRVRLYFRLDRRQMAAMTTQHLPRCMAV